MWVRGLVFQMVRLSVSVFKICGFGLLLGAHTRWVISSWVDLLSHEVRVPL